MSAAAAPGPGGASARQWAGFAGGLLLLVGIVVAGLFLFARGTCACTTPTQPPSPIDGVVIEVDARALGDVRGFTLRTADGINLSFTLGTLENAAEFSPSHLSEHQATSEPVRAWFRIDAGERVVYRLEDAPG